MKDKKQVETSGWKVKTRSRLDRWAPAVALLLVVVALFAGWTTYTAYALEEKPETEEVVTAEWSTNPMFSHSATVERVNPLYEVGERVHSNPVYYTRVMPELEGSYAFEYTATDGGSIDVVTGVEMVVRETNPNGVVYWSQTEELVNKEVTGVEPGQAVRAPFAVNVTDVEKRVESIRAGLGANVGSEEVLLVFTTTMEGEVNGEEVSHRETDRVRVTAGGDTYAVNTGEEGVQGSSFEMTETVEVEPESDGPSAAVSPLLLVVSLGLLVGLGVAKRRDAIAPAESELVAVEREEFDEWISTGALSDDVLENGRCVVRVDSMQDVVDVAIDCGGRVIEDRDKELLSVVEREVVYVYEYDDRVWETTGESKETECDDLRVDDIDTNGEDTEDGEGYENQVGDEVDEETHELGDEKDVFEGLEGTED
jgi:hypothetical protein